MKQYRVIKDKEIGGRTYRAGDTVELHPRQAKYLLGTWLEEEKAGPAPVKRGKAAKSGGDDNA